MYEQKYKKYKQKYLHSKHQNGGLLDFNIKQVTNRVEKQEENRIYYHFVNQLLREHGNAIKGLYHSACFIIVRLLLEPKYQDFLSGFLAKYQSSTAQRYTTTIIEINTIKNLKFESTDETVKIWINENLSTIESACTFLFLFIENLKMRPITHESSSTLHYLKIIDKFFTTCISKQPNPNKTSNNMNKSIDVYRADAPGNTTILMLLFMLLSVYDFVDNEKMYIYVVIGILLMNSNNFQELLIFYASVFKDNKDSDMLELYNLALTLYKEDNSENTSKDASKDAIERCHKLINKIIKNDTAATILTSRYIRYLMDNEINEFRRSRGIRIVSNIMKIKNGILESGIADISDSCNDRVLMQLSTIDE